MKKTKGYQDREELREAIANLAEDKTLQLEPDASETVRKLKVAVRWAAKEVLRPVAYGETPRGTLLVWIDNKEQRQAAPTGKKRGRPRKNPETAQATLPSTETTAE
jgi:hypothetical protein